MGADQAAVVQLTCICFSTVLQNCTGVCTTTLGADAAPPDLSYVHLWSPWTVLWHLQPSRPSLLFCVLKAIPSWGW